MVGWRIDLPITEGGISCINAQIEMCEAIWRSGEMWPDGPLGHYAPNFRLAVYRITDLHIVSRGCLTFKWYCVRRQKAGISQGFSPWASGPIIPQPKPGAPTDLLGHVGPVGGLRWAAFVAHFNIANRCYKNRGVGATAAKLLSTRAAASA